MDTYRILPERGIFKFRLVVTTDTTIGTEQIVEHFVGLSRSSLSSVIFAKMLKIAETFC